MWHLILTVTLAGAAAAGTAAAAWWATKVLTGRWPHEIVFGWWSELREQIKDWVQARQGLGIARVVVRAVEVADAGAVTATNVMRLIFEGRDRQSHAHVITERVISLEEALRQFPDLKTQQEVLVAEFGL